MDLKDICVNKYAQGCKLLSDGCPCRLYKETSNLDPHFVRVTFCNECAFWSMFLPTNGKKHKCIISDTYKDPHDYCSEPKKL